MHRRKLWLLAGAVLAALALAATGSARVSGPNSASAKSAGTLVFGAEQGGGPDWCLNLILDVDCNAFWNVVFQTPVIRGAFIFTPKFTYAPDLITHYKFQTKPQRITYYLRKNAKWSDGVPVTGKDWKFTWQTAINAKYKDHIDPFGWQDIKSVTGSKYGMAEIGVRMLDQMVQAGFNTIRLPYSDQLFDPARTPNGIDFEKNSDLQGLTGQQIMDQVIQRAGERGLKVILDRHRPTAAGQTELWYTDHVSEQQWIDNWVMLANRYRENPTVIGADLDNEPHGAATWGDGNPQTDWRAAAVDDIPTARYSA